VKVSAKKKYNLKINIYNSTLTVKYLGKNIITVYNTLRNYKTLIGKKMKELSEYI
jgi:hypothetical protein